MYGWSGRGHRRGAPSGFLAAIGADTLLAPKLDFARQTGRERQLKNLQFSVSLFQSLTTLSGNRDRPGLNRGSRPSGNVVHLLLTPPARNRRRKGGGRSPTGEAESICGSDDEESSAAATNESRTGTGDDKRITDGGWSATAKE